MLLKALALLAGAGTGSVVLSPPRSPMMSMSVPRELVIGADGRVVVVDRPRRSVDPPVAGGACK